MLSFHLYPIKVQTNNGKRSKQQVRLEFRQDNLKLKT